MKKTISIPKSFNVGKYTGKKKQSVKYRIAKGRSFESSLLAPVDSGCSFFTEVWSCLRFFIPVSFMMNWDLDNSHLSHLATKRGLYPHKSWQCHVWSEEMLLWNNISMAGQAGDGMALSVDQNGAWQRENLLNKSSWVVWNRSHYLTAIRASSK